MHVPKACAVDGGAYVEYFALGDFDSPGPSRGHFLGEVGTDLPEIARDARMLVFHAEENDRTWLGRQRVATSGDVDALLLPSLASCTVAGGFGTGSLLAPIGSDVLVVGGTANPKPPTNRVRHDTGQIEAVRPDLRTPRTHGASATAFAEGLLLAGGVGEDGSILDTAEVFDPLVDGFDQSNAPLLLSEARSEQGAVVLATGETLLVGGVGGDGKTLLSSMEIVDPRSRTVRAEGVARLAVARRGATVLRLASGEILVAGGLGSNGPVTRLEWFNPSVSAPTPCSADLVASENSTFVALSGGGALAVIVPPPEAGPAFPNAWVVDADCAIEPGVPIAGSLSHPVLFGGAGGAPLLWTGDRWLRWAPWRGSFESIDVLDRFPARVGEAASPDSGLAVWLDAATAALTAFRFDVRGTYSNVPPAMLVADAEQLAPDRLASAGVVAFDTSAGGLGGLVLSSGASAFVTDRTYASVAIDFHSPTGEPALLVFRDDQGKELEVGGPSCFGATPSGISSIHVERRGGTVRWSLPGGETGTCANGVEASSRLSLGLRGVPSAARSVVRDLRVSRLSAN